MRYYQLLESFDTKDFELKLYKILKDTILQIIHLKPTKYYVDNIKDQNENSYYLYNQFYKLLEQNVTELIRNDVVKYSENGKTVKLNGGTFERSIDNIDFVTYRHSDDSGHYFAGIDGPKTILFVNVHKYKKLYNDALKNDWIENQSYDDNDGISYISDQNYKMKWLFGVIVHEYTHLLQDIKNKAKNKGNLTDLTYAYDKTSKNKGKRGLYNRAGGEYDKQYVRYLSQRIESGANANAIVGDMVKSISDGYGNHQTPIIKSVNDYKIDFDKPKPYDEYYNHTYEDLMYDIDRINSYNNTLKSLIHDIYYHDIYNLYYSAFKQNGYNYEKPEELKKAFNRFMKDVVNGLNKREIDPTPYIKLAREMKFKYKIKNN